MRAVGLCTSQSSRRLLPSCLRQSTSLPEGGFATLPPLGKAWYSLSHDGMAGVNLAIRVKVFRPFGLLLYKVNGKKKSTRVGAFCGYRVGVFATRLIYRCFYALNYSSSAWNSLASFTYEVRSCASSSLASIEISARSYLEDTVMRVMRSGDIVGE